MKACKDCLYGRKKWYEVSARCWHPDLQDPGVRTEDWWRGEVHIAPRDLQYCSVMRLSFKRCGEEARLFVSKEDGR